MPPYGLMNVNRMSEADAALMRVHVHLRCGMHSGEEPVSGAGIAVLYDMVLLGMHEYIARHEECAAFVANADLWDATALYHALARAGVFDDPRTFNRFSLIVERALWQGSVSSDAGSTFAEVETILAKLGLLPIEPSPG